MFAIKTTVFSYRLKGFCFLLAFFAGMTINAQNKGGSAGAPDWVRDPYKKFDERTNVAAVGVGNSREAAEKDALGKLVAIFGQSIQVDEKISTSYREAVQSGAAASWSENTAIDNTIQTSAGMDSLIGAEIGDTWFDGKANYYAAAVLNKIRALQVYSNMIRANQAIIDNLVNMPTADKNSFDGFARYQFAAMIADMSFSYGNLLSYIGAPSFAQGLKKGDDYRLEAQNIAKTIPIGITVNNDKSGRIQGAFAKAFADLGFRSGGTNARYVLMVDITASPVEFPNQQNKFTRIELTANLTDTSVNTVLFPFNFNNREGHATQSEADNRAYTAAARKISEEYPKLLNGYLSQLLPKKK
jgi:hypothetical protein